MPVPSTVRIWYDGTNITSSVLWRSAQFSMSANAGPGSFSMTIRDKERTRSYVTGKTVELEVDGHKLFGGFVTQIGQSFAFPVVDTTDLSTVTARQITLRGVSYNILFDRLVAHDDNNPTEGFAFHPPNVLAGDMVKFLVNNYIDLPPGFDLQYVDNDMGIAGDPDLEFNWVEGGKQGVAWRQQMEWVSLRNAAVFYIDANKHIHYHAPESKSAEWGFSDRPNYRPVTGSSSASFNGATYGFREMEAGEDISSMANDVFVWGGIGSWANPGVIVYARYPDAPYTDKEQEIADSQAQHGRWQYAEHHFNESKGGLGLQVGVDARAQAIAAGPPGTALGETRGRGVPNQTLSLAWYAHDTPLGTSIGSKVHLDPGDIVTSLLYVHGNDGRPLVLTLPLRELNISIAEASDYRISGSDPEKYAYVRFDGNFGISIDDPYGLWAAIRASRQQAVNNILDTPGLAGPDSMGSAPGDLWQGPLDPNPDGTQSNFFVTVAGSPARYMNASSEVYLNGLRQRPGADYYETPTEGKITFYFAPRVGDALWAAVRLAG